MLLLSIHVARDNNRPQDDDRISFYTEPETSDMVKVCTSYKGCGKTQFTCTMPRDRCAFYVHTLLRSLTDDNEPFENITINSAMFPSVLFSICDLSRPGPMATINDMLFVTFDVAVRRTVSRGEDDS